jgi:hypothetical protein
MYFSFFEKHVSFEDKKNGKTLLPLSKSKGRDNKQVIIAFPTQKKINNKKVI